MDSGLSAAQRLAVRPDRLLTQNRNLRRDGIFNWCLPAWAGRMADGRTYNACPSAGICAKVCYARAGSYRFRPVRERHERNLAYVLDDLPGFTQQMIDEIGRKRRGIIVRVHDAGDFFSDAYLQAWLTIMQAHPGSRFYCYTKEIRRFKKLVEPCPPFNFRWVYSYGGTQDDLLDQYRDRVVDVFPTVEALRAAGYHDQSASDLLAVDGPAPVGIPANRIPHFLKLQGQHTFRSWQIEADAARPPAAGSHRPEHGRRDRRRPGQQREAPLAPLLITPVGRTT
jgi:hypothetical protein